MDKAAVIVPVYNAEKYLHRCLDSILRQDYGNFEVILVDDQSPDGSYAIAAEYRDRYPEKIRLVRNPENIGQGRSRMKAVAMTDADYIMFVDSDDYIAPDYIRRYMAENTDEYDLLIGPFIKDREGKLDPFRIADSEYTLLLYSVACCKAYRRSFLTENGIDFSGSRKGEDIFFSLACYYHRPKYKIISYAGYYYRDNMSSTTRSMNYENCFEQTVTDMFREFRERFDPRNMTEEMRRKVEYTYIANMVNALAVYNRGCGPARMKEKLAAFRRELDAHFPGYTRNRDLRFFRPAGVSGRIRAGVGAFYWSARLHLDGVLFGLIARI